jgi:hypothetical protein
MPKRAPLSFSPFLRARPPGSRTRRMGAPHQPGPRVPVRRQERCHPARLSRRLAPLRGLVPAKGLFPSPRRAGHGGHLSGRNRGDPPASTIARRLTSINAVPPPTANLGGGETLKAIRCIHGTEPTGILAEPARIMEVRAGFDCAVRPRYLENRIQRFRPSLLI